MNKTWRKPGTRHTRRAGTGDRGLARDLRCTCAEPGSGTRTARAFVRCLPRRAGRLRDAVVLDVAGSGPGAVGRISCWHRRCELSPVSRPGRRIRAAVATIFMPAVMDRRGLSAEDLKSCRRSGLSIEWNASAGQGTSTVRVWRQGRHYGDGLRGMGVDAPRFPGNPCDGDPLAEQLEQTRMLLQDVNVVPNVALVDLGYRGAKSMGCRSCIVVRPRR